MAVHNGHTVVHTANAFANDSVNAIVNALGELVGGPQPKPNHLNMDYISLV